MPREAIPCEGRATPSGQVSIRPGATTLRSKSCHWATGGCARFPECITTHHQTINDSSQNTLSGVLIPFLQFGKEKHE